MFASSPHAELWMNFMLPILSIVPSASEFLSLSQSDPEQISDGKALLFLILHCQELCLALPTIPSYFSIIFLLTAINVISLSTVILVQAVSVPVGRRLGD